MPAANLEASLIVGLEIHVQLATRTKLFCGCALEFGAEPNSRVCPVCLGHPGVLPVMNRKAYKYAVRAGLALDCRIARITKWDRKSYYYPDLPKNYQISQYDQPLAADGHIDIPLDDGSAKRIRIRRVHLEEDAGKNIHDQPGCTLVDLNRAGTPLLEIVTEPDINSPREAATLARELQKIVRHIGIAEADMQKGHMRFEPNINTAIKDNGDEVRTPIVEVKNLNSFRSLERSIAHESRRQVDEWSRDRSYTLEDRGKQNRGWDDAREITLPQREKEDEHEYRYFPDPDLALVRIEDEWIDRLRVELPEIPAAREARFRKVYGLTKEESAILTEDRATADLFEAAIDEGGDAKTLAKQCVSFWSRHANERSCTIAQLGIDYARIAELATMASQGEITATAAASIASLMLSDSSSPKAIAEHHGLMQTKDVGLLETWVDEAIAGNPKAVSDYQSGGKRSKKAFGFLQGQVMQKSRGAAPPQKVQETLKRKLDG